ncbi:MAG: hypothetical protein LBK08_04245 [Treponema sp.]|jgi:hypothetical protein|nr:hypothetical protein [Treponema sp.]
MKKFTERRLCAVFAVLFFFLFPPAGRAEDEDFDFGFDGEDEGGGSASLPVSVKLGGRVQGDLLAFFDDLNTFEELKKSRAGDIFDGALYFSASASNADAVINLKLGADRSNPLALDEAFLRGYFGPVSVEAGLRKLAWGRADSFGPLDVVNPIDYSDLSRIMKLREIKIARPMVHGTADMGNGSRFEAVFIPGFEGHRFASSGRWTPPVMTEDNVLSSLVNNYSGALSSLVNNYYSLLFPDTGTIEHMQAGARFTTTLGSADFGAQYFFGNLFRPSYCIGGIDAFLLDFLTALPSNPRYTGNFSLLRFRAEYNRYHQIGADWAQVLAGFNMRAELAAHITQDLAGDSGWVRNPFISWSLGFDRDTVWEINVNLQCNESIRLFGDKKNNLFEISSWGNEPPVSTRLTLILSKKFLRDNLEVTCTGIFDPEETGFYFIPAVSWTIGEVTADLQAGVFAGKKGGELSHYRNSGYIKTALTYSF